MAYRLVNRSRQRSDAIGQIPGLVRAWDARNVLTASGDHVYAVAPAWGTSAAAIQSSDTYRPTIKPGFGPNGDDVISFDDGTDGQYFTFAPTATLTEFTVIFVGQIYNDSTKTLLARTNSGGSYIRFGSTGLLSLRPVDGSGGTNFTLPGYPTQLLKKEGWHDLSVRYSAANELVQAGLDGNYTTPAALTNGHNFIFDEMGGRRAPDPFQAINGHMSVLLIYDRWLSDAEITRIRADLAERFARKYFVSPSTGSNTSKTPWSKTTPWADLYTAIAFPWVGGETIALKSGETSRLDAFIQPPNITFASTQKVTIDGNVPGFGNGTPHLITPARNPTPSLVSGTVYDCGIVHHTAIPITGLVLGATTQVVSATVGNKLSAADIGVTKVTFSNDVGCPQLQGLTGTVTAWVDTAHFSVDIDSSAFDAFTSGGSFAEISKGPETATSDGATTDHVYYVPGGTFQFWADDDDPVCDYDHTNIVRLTKAASYTNAPVVGQWSYWPADSKIYVNAGVSLGPNEIQIPLKPSQAAQCIDVRTTCWDFKNFDVAFSDARMLAVLNTGFANITNVRAICGNSDGFDLFNSASAVFNDCVATRIGGGTDGSPSANPGDGYSFHDVSSAVLNRCLSILNDKSGFGLTISCTVVLDRCFAYNHRNYWWGANAATAGSITLTNSIAVSPAGFDAYVPCAVRLTGTATVGTPAYKFHNNTFVSKSANAAYIGFRQETTDATIDAQNNIWVGWNVALQAHASSQDTGWTLGHQCFHGNVTNSQNLASLGAGNVLADPLLVASDDFSLDPASPCKGAAVALLGILADRAGRARSVIAPTIGAYE